jgi:hypothetical protein
VAQGNDGARLNDTFRRFRTSLGLAEGQGPDVVVLGSLFWDLARICGGTEDSSECRDEFLSPRFVREWMRDFAHLFRRVKAASWPSEPIMVFHTQV